MAAATELHTEVHNGVDVEVLVYSYYRDAELRGSNSTYRLLRILKDDESQILLSEHLSDETLEVLRSVTRDEGWHIDWVRQKAREIAAHEGTPECCDEVIDRYRSIDREVMVELHELERGLLEAL